MDSINHFISDYVAEKTAHMTSRKKRKYVARVNICGNFCGHEPNAHRTALSRPAKTGRGGIPPILNKLIERLSQYYFSPKKLPSLNSANNSERQQRSERREACMLVLRSLLKHTDLSSLRVGEPTKDGFVNRRMIVIKNDTGMSMVRVERAMKDLKAAQIVSSTQPRQLDENGKWRGLAAVRVISKHLFAVFGLKTALEFEQKKAVNRLRKKANDWNKRDGRKRTVADIARFKLVSRRMVSEAKNKAGSQELNKFSKPQNFVDPEYERKRQLKGLELKMKNPNWSSEECYKEADRQLQYRLFA